MILHIEVEEFHNVVVGNHHCRRLKYSPRADLEATDLKYVLNFTNDKTFTRRSSSALFGKHMFWACLNTGRHYCRSNGQSEFVVDTWKHPGISGSRPGAPKFRRQRKHL
ncbi:hypothetical protein K439DRAFT_1622694 [Ramaria rubella]|nr:hypothetical protein K439DRAFT_1622694 [Ramaria rubella]